MTIEGVKGDIWILDANLKAVAKKLVAENPEELGYLDLDKIVFVRCQSADKTDWRGKCFKLAPAIRLLPQYAAGLLGKDEELDELDLRYIVALNEAAVAEVRGPVDKLIAGIVFHELKHIDPDMTKIVKHDTQDFASLLDRFGVHWTAGQFKDDNGVEGQS